MGGRDGAGRGRAMRGECLEYVDASDTTEIRDMTILSWQQAGTQTSSSSSISILIGYQPTPSTNAKPSLRLT